MKNRGFLGSSCLKAWNIWILKWLSEMAFQATVDQLCRTASWRGGGRAAEFWWGGTGLSRDEIWYDSRWKSLSPEWNARSNQLTRQKQFVDCSIRPCLCYPLLRMFSVRFNGCVPLALVLMMRPSACLRINGTFPEPQMYRCVSKTNGTPTESQEPQTGWIGRKPSYRPMAGISNLPKLGRSWNSHAGRLWSTLARANHWCAPFLGRILVEGWNGKKKHHYFSEGIFGKGNLFVGKGKGRRFHNNSLLWFVWFVWFDFFFWGEVGWLHKYTSPEN